MLPKRGCLDRRYARTMSDLAYASTLLPCQVHQTCLQFGWSAVCS